MAAEHGQVGQALDVVGAGGMLGNAQDVTDGAGLGLGVPFRRLLELGNRHPGNFGGPLRGKFIDHLLQGREILRPRLDKGLVVPAVLIDDMHEAVDQGHVGSQAVLYMQMGQGGDLGPPGIDHDELGPIGPGPHQAHGGNGVGHRGVRADGEDTIGVFQFGKGVGHCPTAKGGGQPGHRGQRVRDGRSDRCGCGRTRRGQIFGRHRFLRWCSGPSPRRRRSPAHTCP